MRIQSTVSYSTLIVNYSCKMRAVYCGCYVLYYTVVFCFVVALFNIVLVILLREGIVFSMVTVGAPVSVEVPPNISFFEVLCEFTSKLMKQDKKTV